MHAKWESVLLSQARVTDAGNVVPAGTPGHVHFSLKDVRSTRSSFCWKKFMATGGIQVTGELWMKTVYSSSNDRRVDLIPIIKVELKLGHLDDQHDKASYP